MVTEPSTDPPLADPMEIEATGEEGARGNTEDAAAEKHAEELKSRNQEALRSIAEERAQLDEAKKVFILEKAEAEEQQRLAAEELSKRDGELIQKKVNLDSHEEELAVQDTPSLATAFSRLCASPTLSPYSSSPRRCRSTVPPHHRETWGYRGVRMRPSGGFSTEIRFHGMRLGHGNFDTTNKAARAYDVVAWCLRWPHRTLNFPNVPTRERLQELTPLPRLSTDEDHGDNWRWEHRLDITEMDEEDMLLWRQCFPQDIINKREFYAKRRAERDKSRVERAPYREDKRRRNADAQFNTRLGVAPP
ncbi:uncharacterized protein LOC119279502 [Triticum dicoccoides]|uniref:uncharacterized protein LOC119279502 n=1 Tax=Triticum dicoccoides TaxID=85692 RepID=UPI00189017C3|nr:uncharacterized protein LOC119279502 [Triticum dicoccoides]